MKGHFLVDENEAEEFDISFQVNSTMTDDIPKNQQELYVKAEAACNVIKSLEHTDKQTKRKYFDKLVSLSQVGLVADPAQTEAAEYALLKLKEEIVLVEGKRIKNHYMQVLGIAALILGGLTSAILGVCFYMTSWSWCIPTLCIVIGALAGTWISFGARKFEVNFEDLASLEKDKMTPAIRLIYISVAAIIFTLLMNVGIVDVKIGSVDMGTAFTDVKPAFVIGTLCGLVESRIGIQIYKKAVLIIGENDNIN